MKNVRRILSVVAMLGGSSLAAGLDHTPAALASGGHHYYVAPGGTNASCTANSAANPFGKIQDALNCAAADGTTPTNPDYIHIAPGTYTENLHINADVTLYGAGQSTTVVHGLGTDSVVTNNGHSVRMNRLTITGGNAGNGGGINNQGSLVLVDSTVTHNQASNVGGGIATGPGQLTLLNSTVTHNQSNSAGGGISNGGPMTLTGSTVSYNVAVSSGGGGIDNAYAPAMLTDTSVVGNHSPQEYSDGAGISNFAGLLKITGGSISGNVGGVNAVGGGIMIAGTSTVSIKDVTLENNKVQGDSGEGGGIFTGGSSTTTLQGSTVKNNTAYGLGGGVATDGTGPLTLQSVTITGNHSDEDGGGIFDNGDDTCKTNITLTSTIVTGNTPDDCS